MENRSRAWIHCRVSNKSLRFLLGYQEKRMMSYCESENMKIAGVSKEVCSGKNPADRYLSVITSMIQENRIDYIIVYDWTRLLIFQDLYMEFRLLCEMYGVEIIELKEP